jgi:hypothetical protein
MNGAIPVAVGGVEADTFPVCTSRAASRARAPWRWYSCSTRTGRLRYGGSAHSFGFAIYSAALQDADLRTGLPTGTPQEALDTACTVHLAGLGHEPNP